MKSVLCFFLILMLLLTGCAAHVHHVHRDEVSYALVNKEVEGKEASITLASGQETEGEVIGVTVDSISWVEIYSHSKQIVPASDVKAIETPLRKERGHFIGALAVGGAVLGLMIGAVVKPKNTKLLGGEDIAPLYYLGGVLIGATAGCLIGIAAGQISHKYILNGPTDSASQEISERPDEKP